MDSDVGGMVCANLLGSVDNERVRLREGVPRMCSGLDRGSCNGTDQAERQQALPAQMGSSPFRGVTGSRWKNLDQPSSPTYGLGGIVAEMVRVRLGQIMAPGRSTPIGQEPAEVVWQGHAPLGKWSKVDPSRVRRKSTRFANSPKCCLKCRGALRGGMSRRDGCSHPVSRGPCRQGRSGGPTRFAQRREAWHAACRRRSAWRWRRGCRASRTGLP